jgi:predicted amidohydrolase YtcJ
MSPTDLLYPGDMTFVNAKTLGRERVRRSAPARSLLAAGSILAYGSDWDNIPAPDPWLALQALVTRRNQDNPAPSVKVRRIRPWTSPVRWK